MRRIRHVVLAPPQGKVSAKPTDEVFGNNVTSFLCGGSKPPPYENVAKRRDVLLPSPAGSEAARGC